MSTFAEQLKNEIARIARKETRADSKQVKKASAQYRAEIAALKRRIAILESAVSRLLKQQQPKGAVAKVEDSGPALRFRVAGFASLRKKLGMTAHEMAKLLGVSAQSVYHWETGKSRPRASQLQTISAVRKLSKKEAWDQLSH